MSEKASSSGGMRMGTQFTVELTQVELTDEECSALQNQITKAAIESVRASGRTSREPFVKIIHVKAIPPGGVVR